MGPDPLGPVVDAADALVEAFRDPECSEECLALAFRELREAIAEHDKAFNAAL